MLKNSWIIQPSESFSDKDSLVGTTDESWKLLPLSYSISSKKTEYATYADDLKSLLLQFSTRFSDFFNEDSTFAIFANPMTYAAEKVPENLQLELIELHVHLLLKSKFDEINLVELYKTYLTQEKYVIICLSVSTYNCENK